MIGDIDDIRRRIRLTLPTRWFGDVAPILDGVLSGLAAMWSTLYQLLLFVVQQSRMKTATGQFLEMAGRDYLSDDFWRRPNEADEDYRVRLLVALQRSRATRPAIIAAAASAGYTLSVFEAAQPADTGAYNVPTRLAWNSVGAWGSLQMPLESLIVARPLPEHFENELWKNLDKATPAGGALWVRIETGS